MNESSRPEKENVLFFLALASAVIAGFFLRVYLLKDQVFADDEWHGFYYAIGKSPFWLLTHFSIPGATCIPLNFYTWLLGATAGWSEMLLRLPSLVCGILCLLVCPWLARDIIGPRRAAWLALFLAISPQLIFYSRIARPYSMVALFGFASIICAAHWARSGSRRFAVLFVITGVLAIYFHLFAVITVMAPALVSIACHLYARYVKKPATPWLVPSWHHWIIAGLLIGATSVFLLSVPMIHSLQSTFFTIAFAGQFRLHSLLGVVMFLAGSGEIFVMVLFMAAVIAGAVEQCRSNPWFGWTLVSLYPLHAIALLISHPDSSQAAVVLVRYSIPLVPASLLFAACGLQVALDMIAARTKFRPSLQVLIAFACVTALALAGPLPQTYYTPNNFTSHGAFQHRYEPIDWTLSFSSDLTPPSFKLNTVIEAEEVSPFYPMLGKNPNGRPIVEYPMMIGDHCDPLYYYQHFHRRPVIVGYTTDVSLRQGLAAGNIYGNTYIDQVLSLVRDPSRLHFRNMISMDDLSAMRARGVEYIVLHKRFEAQLYAVAFPLPALPRLYKEYSEKIGAPAYEDAHIAVWHL
jgi:hypothetical protein